MPNVSRRQQEPVELTIPVGKPVSHAFAKEVLAGFAGAEVDKLAETKGMDEYDRERAKHHVSHCVDVAFPNTEAHESQARESAENMYDQHYVRGQGADQYDPNSYGPSDRLNY